MLPSSHMSPRRSRPGSLVPALSRSVSDDGSGSITVLSVPYARCSRIATSLLVLPSALRTLDMSSFAVNDALLAWWHVGVKQLSSVASAHDVASSLSYYTSEPLLPPSPQTMSTEGVQRL